MREFYGATEGNVGLINMDEVPGMLGRILPGQALVKVTPGTSTPMRGSDGRLVRARPGEEGLLLGEINEVNRFDGYVDREKNETKVRVDPFGDGKSYFDTGDLLKLHPKGYLSFSDRLGDTSIRRAGERCAWPRSIRRALRSSIRRT